MHDSLRNGTYTAVGWGVSAIVLALCVWSWTIWDLASQRAEYQQAAQHETVNADKRAQSSIESDCLSESTPNAIAECVQKETKIAEKERREAYDLSAQQEMSYWALGMLLASVIALILTVVGVAYVRLTLLETRRIGQAQVRAYLTCDGGSLRIGSDEIAVTCNLRNTGQSPTSVIKIEGDFHIVVDGQVYVIESTFIDDNGPSIAAQSTGDGWLWFSPEVLPPNTFAIQNIRKRTVIIHAAAKWIDVFGDEQTVTFNLRARESDWDDELLPTTASLRAFNHGTK